MSAPSTTDPAPSAQPAFPALDPIQAEAADLLTDLHRTLSETPHEPGATTRLLGLLRPRRSRPRSAAVAGVYLWGGVGRGKTYLMDWFVDELPLPGKRRLHFHHFMRAVHGAMARLPKTPDPLEVVAERWRAEVRVLCLDELVVTDIADAMILHRLLHALIRRGITLVTTSNTRPRELYRSGLQRAAFLPAIDLIERHTRVFELDAGTDYRQRALEQTGVWLAAEPDDTAMAACFERLTGGHAEPLEGLYVNGRALAVRRLGTDVVWVDFDALCASPRSTSDYIEIARDYHSLLLSGLPALTPANEAAARRFVHLVDELYDQRVRLVVCADVPLERLYPGGIHDFPGERLLSRLTEMRSHDYLAGSRAARDGSAGLP